MGTTKTNDAMYQRIALYGMELLAIFPNSMDRNPVKLCKRLRQLQSQAERITLRLCNGPEYADEDAADRMLGSILDKVNNLLGNRGAVMVPVFINRDPRGYALKIDDGWMRERLRDSTLQRDWGGYGIIAPDLSESN